MPQLRSLLILLLRSLPLVLEKKPFNNFLLRSLRPGHVKKKQNFISALRSRSHDHEKYQVYIKFHKKYLNQLLLRRLRRDHDKKVYFFFSATLHLLHRDDEKKVLFPLLLIATTFTTLRLCLLRSLRRDHDKNICFHFSTTCTT